MKIIKQNLRIYVYPHQTQSIDWYINDRLPHREDGPSNIWNDGDEYYYLKGKRYSKDKDSYWKEIHANY